MRPIREVARVLVGRRRVRDSIGGRSGVSGAWGISVEWWGAGRVEG